MTGKGLLHVTMEPREGLSLDQFHEWYNNEHGPARLRLPHIFPNGLRYRATDGATPTFLAIYDVTGMAHLETPIYTDLRAYRSPREGNTIGQIDVNRRFFDLVAEQKSPLFMPIENLTDAEAEGIVLISVEVTLRADADEKEVIRWYAEEHIPMLAKVPGWLRSRIYRTPSVVEPGSTQQLRIATLHEFARENGLDGPEHKASMATRWRDEVFAKQIDQKFRRAYELFYVFGPGPRDLHSLSRLPEAASFVSADGRIKTRAGSETVISAYVNTADGLAIPYRLEGNPAPDAPTVAFSNSLLTSLAMWDPLVAILKAKRPDLRILRYDTRGRHEVPSPPVPATLDMLVDDLETLLSGLRIDKLHALVGVSMGGATTLKFALRYPQRLDRFVACDFNVASSDANTTAWKDRIAVAEGPDGGIRKLAGITVERWFHPHTTMEKKDVATWMTDIVASNSVQGFRYSCQALWNYSMRDEMGACQVPGLFVVGDQDGKGALVKAMDSFKGLLGATGGELKIVPTAGHLPMCESPEGFWEAVEGFL